MRKWILFGLPVIGITASFLLCQSEGLDFISKEAWRVDDLVESVKRIAQEPRAVRKLDRTLLVRPTVVVGSSILIAIVLATFLRPLIWLARFAARCLVFSLICGVLGATVAYIRILLRGNSRDFFARDSWDYIALIDRLTPFWHGDERISDIPRELVLQPLSLVALGSLLGCLIAFFVTVFRWFHVRRSNRGRNDVQQQSVSDIVFQLAAPAGAAEQLLLYTQLAARGREVAAEAFLFLMIFASSMLRPDSVKDYNFAQCYSVLTVLIRFLSAVGYRPAIPLLEVFQRRYAQSSLPAESRLAQLSGEAVNQILQGKPTDSLTITGARGGK